MRGLIRTVRTSESRLADTPKIPVTTRASVHHTDDAVSKRDRLGAPQLTLFADRIYSCRTVDLAQRTQFSLTSKKKNPARVVFRVGHLKNGGGWVDVRRGWIWQGIERDHA